MKRVKVFLGVALLGVAFAAAAATGAKKLTVTYYYIDPGTSICTPEDFTSTNCVLDQQTACKDNSNRQLYLTNDPVNGCITPLTKQ